ncbi:UDP-N-acetylmuramyl-tripeptide synthetase [Rhodococcus rhodnii]|uniref:UDP-N-acetylmuramyl-tripeptide synthetase n=1 Tax=Rhodococcus rhodnii TaxID=38312 RepID=A0A6P2CFJ6_9NOCA|nr:UDP-N-acetylmuramyl-tripeptide synthetase [Rhodococcus rhodnii]
MPPGAVRTVADLARRLGTGIVGDPAAAGLAVTGIGDDSRTLAAGDAYVALPGEHRHGLDFEEQAAAAGAVVVVSDRPARTLPTLLTATPRAEVGPLAAWFHGSPSHRLSVLGVTGTNGKTSTAHFVDAGLTATGASSGLICGTCIRGPGLDVVPERTTPEATTLQRTLAHFVREGVGACAMEVSSHAVVQHRVDGTRYHVMAFTNLGHDHLDYHGSMEQYFAAKAAMFTPDRTAAAAIDIDDPYGARLAATTRVATWTCSLRHPAADVYADRIECDGAGSRFVVHSPSGDVAVALTTLGPHQVANAVVALTALLADGRDVEAAAAGIAAMHGVPGRCEPVWAGQRYLALVDYMHNPHWQRALLPYLRTLASGRLILVLGARGCRDHTKRAPLGRAAAEYADLVVVTDDSPEDEDPAALRAAVLAGAHEVRDPHTRVVEIPDRRTAFDEAVTAAGPGDVVVVAGRGTDPVQRFGSRVVRFDDHAQLHGAIVADRPRTR